MKTWFVSVWSLGIVCLLASGCASGRSEKAAPAIGTIEAGESRSVVALGREAGDTLLEAFRKNDFELAKALPVGDEKNPLTEARFRQVVEKVIRANGGLRGYTYLGDLNTPPYKMLLWKVTFTPGAQKPEAEKAAASETADKDSAAAPDEGVDMLFEMWMGKLNGQARVVGFRFKL